MKRIAAVCAVLLALALSAGCDPQSPPNTKPRIDAGQAKKHTDSQGQQPAPVQGDPSAHNTQEGEVDIHVSWTSENTRLPACEWSKNSPGVGHPCENMAKPHKEGQDYIGLWEYETTGKAGDVFYVAAQGIGVKTMECSVAFKGKYHLIPGDGKRCSGTVTLA